MRAHPSQRLLNVRHRSYKGLVGQEAELEMVGDTVVGPQGPLPETPAMV